MKKYFLFILLFNFISHQLISSEFSNIVDAMAAFIMQHMDKKITAPTGRDQELKASSQSSDSSESFKLSETLPSGVVVQKRYDSFYRNYVIDVIGKNQSVFCCSPSAFGLYRYPESATPEEFAGTPIKDWLQITWPKPPTSRSQARIWRSSCEAFDRTEDAGMVIIDHRPPAVYPDRFMEED